MIALLLLFVAIPGLFCQDSCTPEGYTRLNATSFIKAVRNSNTFYSHREAVEKEANALNGVFGRLAVLDNDTKNEIAMNLMNNKNGFKEAWIGMRCNHNCDNRNNWRWRWSENGIKELPVSWSSQIKISDGYDKRMRIDLTSSIWKWNDLHRDNNKGAIYELIAQDPCASNPCDATARCVSCFNNRSCEQEPDAGKKYRVVSNNCLELHFANISKTQYYYSARKMCDSEPCNNDGSCSNSPDGSYKCDCLIGFGGTNCELKTLETDDNTDFGECPDNPEGFEYGDHCYFISKFDEPTAAKEGTFEEAKDICGEGAILATPIHPILQQFFYEKMEEFILKGIWIGLEQNPNSNGQVKEGWQIFDPHLGLHITIDYVFTPWQFDEPNDGNPSKIENGTENNAIIDSRGYFRDVNKNSLYLAAACQQKLYKKQLFKPLGIGRRISQPITAASISENTMTKCIRTCYLSWACNAISYHRTAKHCHLHLLSVQDHKNVTVIDDGGFEMLYREP